MEAVGVVVRKQSAGVRSLPVFLKSADLAVGERRQLDVGDAGIQAAVRARPVALSHPDGGLAQHQLPVRHVGDLPEQLAYLLCTGTAFRG